jgi:protein TonB
MMRLDMKRTVFLSILLHLCFFAAAFLSAGLMRGSGGLVREKVIFVSLREEVGSPVVHRVPFTAEKAKQKKPPKIRVEKKSARARIKPKENSQEQGATSVPVVSRSDAEISGLQGIDRLEEPADTMFHTGSGYLKEDTDDSSVVQTSVVTIPHSQSSLEVRESSEGTEGRGMLSPDILTMIRNAIERKKAYPLSARKRGAEGTVYIRFRINPRGEPRELEVIRSSGSPILDRATLDIVKSAAPFPSIDTPLEIPVVFRLNER